MGRVVSPLHRMFSHYLVSLTIFLPCALCCSVYIQPGERLCLDNAEGYLGADCTGLINILNLTQPCGEDCPLHLYPLLGAEGHCVSCPRRERWCVGEKRCMDKYTTPCLGVCQHGRLCNETQSCIGWDSPC